MNVGDQIRKTHITIRNFNDYETYNNAFDMDYDYVDAIFHGHCYKTD